MTTSNEIDKSVILYLGNTPNSRKFAKEIRWILMLDEVRQDRGGYARDATLQHEILAEIVKNCDALLKVLQPLMRNERDPLSCDDWGTATLIQTSLWHINRENWIERDAQSTGKAGNDSTRLSEAFEELDGVLKRIADKTQTQHEKYTSNGSETYETVPDDYPTAIIDSIEILRDAVFYAADNVKPKLGRSESENSEIIRKNKLAKEFVRSYWMCFKRFPKTTINKPAYNTFVDFLYAANLSNTNDSTTEHYYFKKVIKNGKDTYGKLHDAMIRLEQSGTTKVKT